MNLNGQEKGGVKDAINTETYPDIIARWFNMDVRSLTFRGKVQNCGDNLSNGSILHYVGLRGLLCLFALYFLLSDTCRKFRFEFGERFGHFSRNSFVSLEDCREIRFTNKKQFVWHTDARRNEVQRITSFQIVWICSTYLKNIVLDSYRHYMIMLG